MPDGVGLEKANSFRQIKQLGNYLLIIVALYFIRTVTNIYTLQIKSGIKIYDVGQGDSVLLKSFAGNKLLIDGGDNWDVGLHLNNEFIFPSCRLKFLILTHPHADHLKGINRVVQNCDVEHIMFNDTPYPSKLFSEFHKLIDGLQYTRIFTRVVSGDHFKMDEFDIYVLWPDEDFLVDGKYLSNINDISPVMLVDAGDFEALLTGDASGVLLSKINWSHYKKYIDGKLDLLKVPHHGSGDGKNISVYKLLNPKYCVISVGQDNRYKHPDSTQIQQLESVGCKILRTDVLGSIEFKLR